MTARVSTNTYCLARTRRFSRRSETPLDVLLMKREAPTDTVQLSYRSVRYLYGNLSKYKRKDRFYVPYMMTRLTTTDYLRTERSRETTVAM